MVGKIKEKSWLYWSSKKEREKPISSSTVTQVVDHVENSNIAQLPNYTKTSGDSVEISTPTSA